MQFEKNGKTWSCSVFPTGMKYAEVTPIHKEDDKTDKEIYGPVSRA